ncbi:MAG: carbohydrate-binding family 9-like protein [Candidatus Acidiferrales bacterium]
MQLIPSYRVRKAPGPIVVDGRLQEENWQEAERFELQKVLRQSGDEQPLRARTHVAALWDEKNLYLAFEVEDDEIWATLREHDARLFREECVEFFIDPAGEGRQYIEAQVNSLNTVRDLLVDGTVIALGKAEYDAMARWHFKALRSAVEIREGWGWTLEAAIPWPEFSFSKRSFPPQPGDEMRVNCYRYERSRTGAKPLELSAWSEVANSFHEPERFGRFILV